MKYFWTRYVAVYPQALLYMLQNTDYRLKDYLSWYHRTSDFRTVMKRRALERTQKIKLLSIGLWTIWGFVNILAAVFVFLAITTAMSLWGLLALGSLLALPFVLAYGIVVPLYIGRRLIQKPREKKMIASARAVFEKHTGTRIAIVGSYGKTTAKEVIATVLSEGLRVAATPGNMNTAIGISRFAMKLKGNEDVLVVEFGEEKVGDVALLSGLTRPTMGVITGINEAHLSSFRSLTQTTKTILELTEYLDDSAVVYINQENTLAARHTKKHHVGYSREGLAGWKISQTTTTLEGTHFTARNGDKVVRAHTKLIGLHTIGITTVAIAIADSLGMSVKQIEAGIAKITPFEHRMEPRRIAGAWVIDDTYNGNIDGVMAGLALLRASNAKRRIYVTPGLVEQGTRTSIVHTHIGTLAGKSADVVVLMKNSVTHYIEKGLEQAGFKGKLIVIDDPLEFYTNLEHFVAAGDVVLMQNDWTDNYK